MPITALGDIDGPDRVHGVMQAVLRAVLRALLQARANLGCLLGLADPCGTAYAAYAAAMSGDRQLAWPT